MCVRGDGIVKGRSCTTQNVSQDVHEGVAIVSKLRGLIF